MQVCRQEEWVGNVFRDTPFKKPFQFLLKPVHTHRGADNHYHVLCVCVLDSACRGTLKLDCLPVSQNVGVNMNCSLWTRLLY